MMMNACFFWLKVCAMNLLKIFRIDYVLHFFDNGIIEYIYTYNNLLLLLLLICL